MLTPSKFKSTPTKPASPRKLSPKQQAEYDAVFKPRHKLVNDSPAVERSANEISEILSSISLLQKTVKLLIKQHICRNTDQIVKIQSLYRGYCVRKRLQKPTFKIKHYNRVVTLQMLWHDCSSISRNSAIEPKGVVLFQAIGKRFLVRSRVQKYFLVNAAAARIQCVWRGFLARKRIEVFVLKKRVQRQEERILKLERLVQQLLISS